jgi:dipeptidase D
MTLKDLKPAMVWEIFDQITKVPRPSKKEEKIIEYLVNFAKENNIEYKVDGVGNVAMFKPATPGCENAPAVVLQSHMDMVCEKASDSTHNFETDPIETHIDGEWLYANKTTLGADNGIGMAAGLAVMVDNTLVHGPVEALFTVDEETGMTGANNLGEGMIQGNIILNLDSEDEAEVFIGCAGGIDTTAYFTYENEAAPAGYEYIKVNISRLLGGHSGCDIHRGRACANKLMARFIWAEMKKFPVALAAISGGNLRNAIAHEGEFVVGVPAADKHTLVADLNKFIADVEFEFKGIEPNMTFEMASAEAPATVIDAKTAKNLIYALYCAPHGVIAMNQNIEGLTETSTNLASVKMKEDNTIVVTTSQRSLIESSKIDICRQVESVFVLAGAKATHGDGYPAWPANVDSEILKISIKAYEELYGITPAVKAIHAGLECALFRAKYENLDMVSFGPTLQDVHSPKERMHIPAVEKFWNHLIKILEMVGKK